MTNLSEYDVLNNYLYYLLLELIIIETNNGAVMLFNCVESRNCNAIL